MKDKRIVVLTQNSYNYVKAQWAVWRSGAIFVPLCIFSLLLNIIEGTTHPPSEMEYYIKDSDASLAICDSSFEHILKPLSQKLNIPCICIDHPKPAASPLYYHLLYICSISLEKLPLPN